MRLIFIRHCEPDYSIDSLTEKGFKEAELLKDRVKNWKVDRFFCSPLGRAQDTARPSLEAQHTTATTYDWLQEFNYRLEDPTTGREKVPWDFMPEYWTGVEELYDRNHCYDAPTFANQHEIKIAYKGVCDGLDAVLKDYGYTRDGAYYHADPVLTKDDEEKTIVFFCHLGVSLVMAGYLLGISPVVLQQSYFLAPSSVTILNTETRMNEIGMFRVQVMGDTSHLRMKNEPVSAAGSFTSVFSE